MEQSKKKNTKNPKTKQQDVKWKLIDTYWDKYNNRTRKTYQFNIDNKLKLLIVEETVNDKSYNNKSCVLYMQRDTKDCGELYIDTYSSLRTAKNGGERFLKRMSESIIDRFDRINKK